MPPLSDALTSYQPSPVTAAASRILTAYLANHRLPAADAARLALRVEAVLGALLTGEEAEATPAVVPAAARAPRAVKTGSARPAPRRQPARQAVLELNEAEAESSAEEAEPAASEDMTVAMVLEEVIEETAEAPVPEIPEPEAPAVEEEEIDLLTGGPLPRAAGGTDFAQEGFIPPEAPAPRKRKRPSRPASRRRAAQRQNDDEG